MTPELRALRDELHERLAGPVDLHQSPEDTQRDWADIRRAYAHHVDQANTWDEPDTVVLHIEPDLGAFTAKMSDALKPVRHPILETYDTVQRQFAELAESITQTAPTPPVNTGPAGWLRRWWSR